MDYKLYIIMICLATFLCSKSNYEVAKHSIKEINILSRYYPEKYITPTAKARRFFKIKQSMIPKYLYYELYVSLSIVLFPIVIALVFILSGFNDKVLGILFWIELGFACINQTFMIIMEMIYKKKVK